MKGSRIVAGLLACIVTTSIFALPTQGRAFKEAFAKVFWVFVVDAPASAK
jgi:hypothetical protein